MPANNIPQRIRDWIETALRESGASQTVLGKAIGISPSAVSRILKGERQIGIEELADTLKFFKKEADLPKILDMQDFSSISPRPFDRHHLIHRTNTTMLKVNYNRRLFASGIVSVRPYDERVDLVLTVPSVCLLARSENDNLRWVEVTGDAMANTINETDLVIFDLGKTSPSNGVYVLEDGFGGAMVRRLELLSVPEDGAMIRLLSDNPRYIERSFLADKIHLLGQCIGIYKQLIS